MTAERVAELGGPTPGVPGAFVGGGPAITPSCAPVAAIEGGRARVTTKPTGYPRTPRQNRTFAKPAGSIGR